MLHEIKTARARNLPQRLGKLPKREKLTNNTPDMRNLLLKLSLMK
jgi:hypothetical protein